MKRREIFCDSVYTKFYKIQASFEGAGDQGHKDKIPSVCAGCVMDTFKSIALMWMVGGLSARSWPHVDIIWPYALIGFILAMLGSRHLNILQLGDDIAKALGVNVELTRIYLTAIGALLAASAVSVAGLLGFVGLIVPHTARLLVGSDYRYLIPSSALLGIAVVTYSDTFARVAFAPLELPVGIFMAILGAPFFLFLLRKEL